MESGRKSLKELFTGDRYFYIPEYQRNYAWEDKQIKDFFEDFKASYNGVNKKYYYGTILLQDKSSDGIKEKYDIVDGQQRLTTLIVFIKCLLERLSKIEEKDNIFDEDEIKDISKRFLIYKNNFVLSLQTDDNEFFHTYIISDNSYADEFKTPSQKRLSHLKDEFRKMLNNVSDEVALSFMEKIYATNILVYLINSRSEAALIFETTNDRGKQLTNLEKTKSYLMYKASLLDDSEQLLSTIQSRFNAIYQDYASFERRQILEDSILQYTFIAYENWSNNKQKEHQHYMEVMKNKVESFLDEKKYEEFYQYVDNYTLNIKESFSIIKRMFSNPCDEFKDLIALDIISIFYPLLIKVFRYDKTEEKQNYRKVCRLLEIFVFRVYVIQKYFTSKFQTKWYELAKRFDGNNFDSLCNSIIELIKNRDIGTDDSFISALEDKNFYEKYSSSTKNYFFWKYENYLRTTKQPIATLMPHDDLKKQKINKKINLSIEHIVARKNTDEHSKIISDEGIVAVGRGDVFNKEYLNAIGNLTIDPQSANSSKGKKDVEEKVSKYFNKAPYKSQNELEDFMQEEKWKIESHKNRQKALIVFAKETWCSYEKYYSRNVTAENLNDIDDGEEE